MENTERYITVCSSLKNRNNPKITMEGSWLENAGYEIGAEITLTNPEPGTLIVKQTKSRDQHFSDQGRAARRDKRLVRQVRKQKKIVDFQRFTGKAA